MRAGRASASRASGIGPGSDDPSRGRPAELDNASTATHRALAGLSEEGPTTRFIATLLREALRAAGSRDGAVVLLQGQPPGERLHCVAMLRAGRPLSAAAMAGHGFDELAPGPALRACADRGGRSSDVVRSSPDDAFYTEASRRSLKAAGIRSVISVRLRAGRRTIGWLGAGYTDTARLDADRRALLRLLADQMTMAVELTRLGESAREAASAQARAATAESRIEQLLAANRALTGALDGEAPTPVIDTVLTYTLQSLGRQLLGSNGSGALWLGDADRRVQHRHLVYDDGRVMPAAASSMPGGDREQRMRVMLEPRYLRGEPFLMQTSQLGLHQRRYHQAMGCRSLIVFPMVLGGRPAGGFFLCLGARHADPSIDDLRFSQAMAQQATLAVELTRLADAARREAIARVAEEAAEARVGELARGNKALKQTLDLLSDELDIGDTLGRLLHVAAAQVDCDAAALCLRDEDGAFAMTVTCLDGVVALATPQMPAAQRYPARGCPLWERLLERRATLVAGPGPGGERHGLETWFVESGARCLLVVPLLQHGEVVGCFLLRFDAPQHFAAERLELLQTLAHQTTLAVQLERLSRAAQSKSERAATLAERARIARDLHDTLAQGLTGILMHLQASERMADADRAREHVRAALAAARDALVDATRSVYALRSIAAERAEFLPALKAVLRTTFAGSGIAAEVHGEPEAAASLDEATENELLRIAQEAATNTLKHARARRFDAHVEVDDDDAIELRFEDDGVGFDPAHDSGRGFGLIGMAERMRRLGGTLRIGGRAGGGTQLVARVDGGTEGEGR